MRVRLQNILEYYSAQLEAWSFTHWHHKVLQAIRRCRTAELGGHIDKCDCCNALHLSYNSCRNRHCPRCQSHKQKEWIQARSLELLNTSYYHLVFTLPSELNQASLHYPKEVYSSLFAASWDTVKTFTKNHLGATPGMISILHTWGQNLSLHPHVHCIVPAGAVDSNGNWIPQLKKRKHLFPVKAMSVVFRAKMLALLRNKKVPIKQEVCQQLFSKNWVIYAKQSFLKPIHVINYLGRYTHRIAISDGRIVGFDATKGMVSFKMKNYKKGGQLVILKLAAKEFIKRFQLHILPKGFTRIRHYGLLSSTMKSKYLKPIQEQLAEKSLEIRIAAPLASVLKKCPYCNKGNLHIVAYFGVRGPPKRWIALLKKK